MFIPLDLHYTIYMDHYIYEGNRKYPCGNKCKIKYKWRRMLHKDGEISLNWTKFPTYLKLCACLGLELYFISNSDLEFYIYNSNIA